MVRAVVALATAACLAATVTLRMAQQQPLAAGGGGLPDAGVLTRLQTLVQSLLPPAAAPSPQPEPTCPDSAEQARKAVLLDAVQCFAECGDEAGTRLQLGLYDDSESVVLGVLTAISPSMAALLDAEFYAQLRLGAAEHDTASVMAEDRKGRSAFDLVVSGRFRDVSDAAVDELAALARDLLIRELMLYCCEHRDVGVDEVDEWLSILYAKCDSVQRRFGDYRVWARFLTLMAEDQIIPHCLVNDYFRHFLEEMYYAEKDDVQNLARGLQLFAGHIPELLDQFLDEIEDNDDAVNAEQVMAIGIELFGRLGFNDMQLERLALIYRRHTVPVLFAPFLNLILSRS